MKVKGKVVGKKSENWIHPIKIEGEEMYVDVATKAKAKLS